MTEKYIKIDTDDVTFNSDFIIKIERVDGLPLSGTEQRYIEETLGTKEFFNGLDGHLEINRKESEDSNANPIWENF